MRIRRTHDRRARATGRAALALVLIAALHACSSPPAFKLQAEEEGLIDAIEETLLSSVEAEKSAVLATTDEEALQMARESKRLAGTIDGMIGDLRTRVEADGRAAVSEAFAAVVTRWGELKAVDERLLALAVANTNLKAARLSAREGLATLDRFVAVVDGMQRSSNDPDTIRTLSGALVAALRDQSLLLIHIPTAGDADMTRLEQQMAGLATSVDRALTTVRSTGAVPAGALDTATEAWAEHQKITVEVVKLSRDNSDVRSFDVSVHEKRAVTRHCLEALTALRTAVSAGPQAKR
jgi:hypothetical protein